MKIKAYDKAINPFHPEPNMLGYAKTVEVSDDTDMGWLEKMAKENTRKGYKFDKIEKL